MKVTTIFALRKKKKRWLKELRGFEEELAHKMNDQHGKGISPLAKRLGRSKLTSGTHRGGGSASS